MNSSSFNKKDLERMILEENLPYNKIGEKYGVSGSYIRKIAKKFNIKLPKRRKINSKESFNKGNTTSRKLKEIYSISDEDFLNIVNKSTNISDTEKLLGYKSVNVNIRKYIRTRCNELGVEITHTGIILKSNNFSINYDNLNNFSRENIKLLGKISGIYMIENNLNHHKYIGQSVNIKSRLLIHISEKTWDRHYNYPLYMAFKKYGIKMFSFRILFIVNENLDLLSLKSKLDSMEIFYISKYNTYRNGYNQTIGGDIGVLGYKMSAEQTSLIKENKKKLVESGKYILWYYNIDTKEYNFGLSSKDVGKKLNIPFKTIRKCGTLIRRKYITARTRSELEKYVEKYYSGEFYNKK